METIVALGGVGCNIASAFEKYSEYEIYKIDSEESCERSGNYLQIPKLNTPEEYEDLNLKKVNSFLEKVSGDILFIVSGASKTSGASLILLESLHKRCNINILYVQPETTLLDETRFLQENTVFNVFQQYSRSGLFSRMFLVSNECIDSLVEDASILDYYSSINEVLVNSFHMINFFEHVEPVSSTHSKALDVNRISTIGILNFETGEEKLFFPLDFIRESRYYYGISSSKLSGEKGLHRKITNQVKEKISENKKISYGIYSTTYDYDCCYVLAHTSMIQKKI